VFPNLPVYLIIARINPLNVDSVHYSGELEALFHSEVSLNLLMTQISPRGLLDFLLINHIYPCLEDQPSRVSPTNSIQILFSPSILNTKYMPLNFQ